MAGNAARSALTNGLPEVLLEVHLQKYLQQHCYSTLGLIVRTRRNPASQTIIPRLSQCSSRAQRHASPAIRRMSDFPGKSAKTRRFGSPCRLTARLPDVGTVTALPSGPIRVARSDPRPRGPAAGRSEEHTSELQSPCNLVCRLLLEKKKHTSTHCHPT